MHPARHSAGCLVLTKKEYFIPTQFYDLLGIDLCASHITPMGIKCSAVGQWPSTLSIVF